jgi:anti-sigma B factor antagonist
MTSPSQFKVEVERGRNVTRMSIEGQIDIASLGRLVEARDQALAELPAGVLIDLTLVDFIDSSGLKFLLDTHRLLGERGCTLMITRPAETAMAVFMLTRTDQHLPFVDPDRS